MTEGRVPSWRVVARGAIAVREWDDELVVYNDLDGNTHHLAPLGGKVLLALLEHPTGVNAVDLTARAGALAGIDEPDVLAPAVDEALDELARLDLVAPVSD
ncbi:MAG: HPr-rel-A system PqqD family peptide chaperone [Casimicrobiaceae bacterium]